jgi:hypothetical protein
VRKNVYVHNTADIKNMNPLSQSPITVAAGLNTRQKQADNKQATQKEKFTAFTHSGSYIIPQ